MPPDLLHQPPEQARAQAHPGDANAEPFPTSPLFKEAFADPSLGLWQHAGQAGSGSDTHKDLAPAPHKQESVVGVFFHSMLYSGLGAPAEGLGQLGHKVGLLNGPVDPNSHWIKPPEHYAKNSLREGASLIGGAIGTILPFIGVSRLAELGRGALAVRELGGLSSAARYLDPSRNPIANIAVKGALYEGTMHPNSDPNHFWHERFSNAAAGALSFAVLGKFGQSVGGVGKAIFGKEIGALEVAPRVLVRAGVVGTGGFISGGINYAADQFLNGQKIKSADLTQNAVQGGLFGAFAGELRELGTNYSEKQPPLEGNRSDLYHDDSGTMSSTSKGFRINPETSPSGNPDIQVDGKHYTYSDYDPNTHTALLIEKNPTDSHLGSTDRGLTTDPADTKFASMLTDLSKTSATEPTKHLISSEDFEKLKAAAQSYNLHGQEYIAAPSGKLLAVQQLGNGQIALVEEPHTIARIIENAQTPWTPATQPANNNTDKDAPLVDYPVATPSDAALTETPSNVPDAALTRELHEQEIRFFEQHPWLRDGISAAPL